MGKLLSKVTRTHSCSMRVGIHDSMALGATGSFPWQGMSPNM